MSWGETGSNMVLAGYTVPLNLHLLLNWGVFLGQVLPTMSAPSGCGTSLSLWLISWGLL